jgi:hypothetical protein
MNPPCELPDEAVLMAEPDEPLVLPEAVALGAGALGAVAVAAGDGDADEDDPMVVDAEPEGGAGVAGAVGAGCIAEEPVVVEPEALAAGRSVAPDGEGVV